MDEPIGRAPYNATVYSVKDPYISHSQMIENVSHPSHYTQSNLECIDAIKASMNEAQFRGYLKGNILKYIWRYELKGGEQDLRKARWYLDSLIKEVSNYGEKEEKE